MDMIEKLIEYFEQQLRLQRESKFKYTVEQAYVDAIDVCKNVLKSNSQKWPSLSGVIKDLKQFGESAKANQLTSNNRAYFEGREDMVDLILPLLECLADESSSPSPLKDVIEEMGKRRDKHKRFCDACDPIGDSCCVKASYYARYTEMDYWLPKLKQIGEGSEELKVGSLVKRFGEVVKEKQDYKEECDRLEGLVKFWQGKYHELNPGWQPPKLDNL